MFNSARKQPLGLQILALLAVTFSACSDINGVAGLTKKFDVVDTFVFDPVLVGEQITQDLLLKSDGTAPIRLNRIELTPKTGTAQTVFQMAPFESTTISAFGERRLTLTFRPGDPRAAEATLTMYDDLDEVIKEVVVQGQGLVTKLELDPDPVNFGPVRLGETRSINVKVTNRLPISAPVWIDLDASGAVKFTDRTGLGLFDVLNRLENISEDEALAYGALAAERLGPGESTTLNLRYVPVAGEGGQDRGFLGLRSCVHKTCERPVEIFAAPATSDVYCAPSLLDFGRIAPGEEKVVTLVCESLAEQTVRIAGWSVLASESGREFSMSRYSQILAELSPGAQLELPVTFAPTQTTLESGGTAEGVVQIEINDAFGQPRTPLRIPLIGRTGEPLLVLQPSILDFGRVALNTRSTRRALLQNVSDEDIEITSFQLAPNDAAFIVNATPAILSAGATAIIEVEYRPTEEITEDAAVIVEHNSVAQEPLELALRGRGIDLGPCEYTVSPEAVAFGTVAFGDERTETLALTNVGINTCLINDLTMEDPESPIRIDLNPRTDIELAPGEQLAIPLTFSPRRSGEVEDNLSFYISSPEISEPQYAVTGRGQVMDCPFPSEVVSGNLVDLTLTNLSSNIAGLRWEIVDAPPGGIDTPNQWSPNPPTAPEQGFRPFIVGTYTLRAIATANNGAEGFCETTVNAIGQGLRVTMNWDGTGDIDLHVLDGDTTAWFNDTDCYYGNRTPVWDTASPAASGLNPELDFDNTSSFGPENTSIDVVKLDSPYTIGVHNYSRGEDRIATITVFCGGGTEPVATFTSRPLKGTSGGNCTANDFWKVAKVQFDSQSNCVIAPIDTYVPSTAACEAF